MNFVQAALQDIQSNPQEFWNAVQIHLQLCGTALVIGFILCFPLGVLASRSPLVSLYAINLVGIARAIPSIAILFVALPYLGLGYTPALVALTILACPPILINTNVGFREVDPALREAAYGMGMNTAQVLGGVELPLALPIVVAGIRIATVEVIASATLATFIGAGGLGDFIAEGLANLDVGRMLEGAIPVTLLTLLAEIVLGLLEYLSRRSSGLPTV